jgi:hypothetical protein
MAVLSQNVESQRPLARNPFYAEEYAIQDRKGYEIYLDRMQSIYEQSRKSFQEAVPQANRHEGLKEEYPISAVQINRQRTGSAGFISAIRFSE